MGENSLFSCLLKTKFWGGFGGVRRGDHFSWVLGVAYFGMKIWATQTTQNQPKPAETGRNPQRTRNLISGASGGFWGVLGLASDP